MPLAQALVFVAAAAVLIFVTQWRTTHPFIAIVAVATAFGYVAGFTTAQLGRSFGNGFAEMIYSPGLVIVAAGFIAALAEATAACDRLMATIDRRRALAANGIAASLGLVAGLGASPAAAFALLTPLLRPIGGANRQRRQSATVTLALAISASHGLAVLTPVPIAAVAILGADWERVALFGLPLAIFLATLGAIFARLPVCVTAASAVVDASKPSPAEATPIAKGRGGRPAIALVLATGIPLLMLMLQSLGDIPSEPLGGGPTRELIIGIGRPLLLFVVGVGIMIVAQPRRGLRLLADFAWSERIIGTVAGILLVLCAAGGLQRLCQETGMAEMLAERVTGWQVQAAGGVLVPFVVAAVLKTLQGSSLVAAITAAGMTQPLLAALGLGGANGKALAALAVGAGAMTVCHVNDEYFWLVAARAELSPLRAIAAISLGTLLQGLVAAVALLLLSLLLALG